MFRERKVKHPPDGMKCIKCPYYLGQIKCIVSPCKECISNGRKTHPYELLQPEKKD